VSPKASTPGLDLQSLLYFEPVWDRVEEGLIEALECALALTQPKFLGWPGPGLLVLVGNSLLASFFSPPGCE
jgi:hypothetical protein